MESAKLQTRFFAAFLLSVLILAFFIYRPYLGAVVLAATFAVIFYPLYRRILKAVGERANIAATITTALVLLIVFVPLLLFGIQIIREAQPLYAYALDPQNHISNVLTTVVQERIRSVAPQFSLNLDVYAQQGLRWIVQHIGAAFSSAAKLVLNLFLSLLTLFYLLRDGKKLVGKIIALSPLKDQQDAEIIFRLQTAVNSVIRGSLVIALLQGAVTGIGLWLFGVPNSALWAGVTVLAALVPNLGTSLVLAPSIAYLFLTDHVPASIGLLVWGILAVGLIDNLLGPRLMSRGTRLHPMITLLSVIGGLQFFGPIGYILGPLVASLLFTLLDIYPRFAKK